MRLCGVAVPPAGPCPLPRGWCGRCCTTCPPPWAALPSSGLQAGLGRAAANTASAPTCPCFCFWLRLKLGTDGARENQTRQPAKTLQPLLEIRLARSRSPLSSAPSRCALHQPPGSEQLLESSGLLHPAPGRRLRCRWPLAVDRRLNLVDAGSPCASEDRKPSERGLACAVRFVSRGRSK